LLFLLPLRPLPRLSLLGLVVRLTGAAMLLQKGVEGGE